MRTLKLSFSLVKVPLLLTWTMFPQTAGPFVKRRGENNSPPSPLRFSPPPAHKQVWAKRDNLSSHMFSRKIWSLGPETGCPQWIKLEISEKKPSIWLTDLVPTETQYSTCVQENSFCISNFFFFCILCFLFCFVLFYILFYFFSFPKFTVYAPYISNFILVLTTVPVAVSSVDGNQSSMTGNVKVRKEGARQKPSSSVALFIRSHWLLCDSRQPLARAKFLTRPSQLITEAYQSWNKE